MFYYNRIMLVIFNANGIGGNMKKIVLLCDGMSDYKVKELDNKTPMATAKKPNMENLAKHGYVGLVQTVPAGQKPGSDVANLAAMGYDPNECYTGRSPLEAASIGIDMSPSDVALRCNLVTLSDAENFKDKVMLDYCADDISTASAKEIIKTLKENFDDEEFEFFSGVSYRHCLIWHGGTTELGNLVPPHDISGKTIGEYLSNHPNAEKILAMMEKSYNILLNHPINIKRAEKGRRAANAIWLWGEGKAASLENYNEKYGVKAAVISAVDLIKGIGKLASMDVIEVEGATGYIDTNFEGKAQACIDALENGCDYVYLHIEAPDECGHRHEIHEKVRSIEIIDEKVLTPILKALEKYDDYKIMILPDHPTPVELMTHTSDPVPFLIYRKQNAKANDKISMFDEDNAKNTEVFVENGPDLMKIFLEY